MGLEVINGGIQTTMQGSARIGFRHKGVPGGGPADRLSHALANRLVGNQLDAVALEITLGGASFRFTTECRIGLTGGEAEVHINGVIQKQHRTMIIRSGDILNTGPITKGARIYLSVAGGFVGDQWLGSASTYLPAGLGGFGGRPLKAKDKLRIGSTSHCEMSAEIQNTPPELDSEIRSSWILRATPGPETDLIVERDGADFFGSAFTISNRASRMGIALDGQTLQLESDGRLPSAAVFPGTVQCTSSGQPFLLLADAQTTGGYPRIAQVIRADRHLMGQLRPGDRLQFQCISRTEAALVLKKKTDIFRSWLGDEFNFG